MKKQYLFISLLGGMCFLFGYSRSQNQALEKISTEPAVGEKGMVSSAHPLIC